MIINMKTQKLKNRWLIAASAVGIHISIGSVYAYSVMTNPVKDIFDVDGSVIKWAFKIAILLLGLSAAFLGRWVEKVGPKVSGTTAGIFYGIGILGSGLAVQLESLWLFYLCYGVIGGIGLGLGYITPVSTLVKWFPDRRGLATGMAIMGFGFAALIFGPVMQSLFDSVGVSNAFYILGVIYMVLILSSARYIERPPEGYLPEGYNPGEGKTIKKDIANISADAALKTPRFYYIWIMMFINIACGIAIISFLVVLFTVITMYGGGFATLPAFLGDLFGTKQLGAIHGMVLAAWGLAGVVGPTIYDMVKTATGSLDTTLEVFAGLFIVALLISFLMKRTVVRAHKTMNQKKIDKKLKYA